MSVSESFCNTYCKKKGRTFPLQALGFQKVQAPEFLDNRHMKVVSPTHRPSLPPGRIPGTDFCYRLSRPQGHNATGRIKSLKNSSDSIRNRTRDLPACSPVPQPTAPPRTNMYCTYIFCVLFVYLLLFFVVILFSVICIVLSVLV
jgi:hypothetical protein